MLSITSERRNSNNMYRPLSDEELEEKYRGQLDDPSPPQYAFYYGTRLNQIAESYDLMDIDLADAVIYWLKRYLDQEETEPECAKEAGYIVAKLMHQFPELREEYRQKDTQ